MKSIVTKLWLAILLLVVGVLLISGLFLNKVLTDFYFELQASALISRGEAVVGFIKEDKEADAIAKAQVLAEEAKATIVIADPTGLVRGCSPNMRGRFMQGMHLSSDELKTLEDGRVAVRLGNNPYFENKMLWVAVPVKEQNKLVKTVVLFAPVEPMKENAEQVRDLIITTAGVGLVLSTILALLLSKTISRPLVAMNQVATQMIHGDFGARVEVKSHDEVGRLGNTLNSLSGELEQTMSALSYEKQQLANILSSMTDGVISFSSQGVITMTNPRATDLMAQNGVSVCVNMHLEDCCPLEEVKEMFIGVLNSGQTKIQEVNLHKMIISIRMSPLREDSGQIKGVVAVFQDVTKERKLDKIRKDFVANVSHELRTPLCLLQGYGEALLDGLAEDRQQRTEMVGIIVDETRRMQRLVNELLDLAKVEAGAITLLKEPINLGGLLTKVAKKFETIAKDASVNLHLEFVPDLGIINADHDRMDQVLTNLMDNAIRHTSSGGTVSLMGKHLGDTVMIRVADNGQGIDEEELPHIWERFYKVDKARTRKTAGTGLGLSIVKALVEAHGGFIEVDSKVSLGTTFTLTMPVETS